MQKNMKDAVTASTMTHHRSQNTTENWHCAGAKVGYTKLVSIRLQGRVLKGGIQMTPTEKLIAEARELCGKATPGPWVYNVTELSIDTQGENSAVVYALTDGQGYPMVSVHDNDAQFIVRSRTLIPALCDALEQAQATLEQTWEWDMYKAAQKEIERLRKELAALASESVKRDIALAKLEAEVMAAIEAQNAQRWIPVTERLPERNDKILAYTPQKPGYAELIEVSRGFMAQLGHRTSITHWQPLPQPPKGEDKT
jgi:hypothetical protein